MQVLIYGAKLGFLYLYASSKQNNSETVNLAKMLILQVATSLEYIFGDMLSRVVAKSQKRTLRVSSEHNMLLRFKSKYIVILTVVTYNIDPAIRTTELYT